MFGLDSLGLRSSPLCDETRFFAGRFSLGRRGRRLEDENFDYVEELRHQHDADETVTIRPNDNQEETLLQRPVAHR